MKLTAIAVKKLNKPGYHGDGGGLYLAVGKSGSRSWVFRYRQERRLREMGLGSASDVSLADAREKAQALRKLRIDGHDPIQHRQEKRISAKLEAARTVTFDACAEAYIAAQEAHWRNPKHRQQWRNTIKTYASPVFGDLSIAALDKILVIKALEPIWTTKPETASRLRGRIETIIDWAIARGYREGPNPATLKGNIGPALPKIKRAAVVTHHAALAYEQIPEFMAALRLREGFGARALEFTILTAARSGETRGAIWGEINWEQSLWAIPGERMKPGRPHTVPLSVQALNILRAMKKANGALADAYVFPGARRGSAMSDMTLSAVLRRMGQGELTVHGFRSTFRDWVSEQTNYSREVSEMALAHTIRDKVEAAYRRGDLLEKRARLMRAWAEFCDKPIQENSLATLQINQ